MNRLIQINERNYYVILKFGAIIDTFHFNEKEFIYTAFDYTFYFIFSKK